MSRRHIPYFNFYPGDFMSGVRGLTAQEVGLYTMILCRIYEESGPVEYHPMRLSVYCGMRETTFIKTLEKLVALGKLTLVDGMLSNPRAEVEISDRAHNLKTASKAGKASAEKRQQKQGEGSTTVQRPFNDRSTIQTQTQSIPTSSGAAPPLDPDKVMFDSGRLLLVSAGKSADQAGRLLGRWRKDCGTEAVIAAIGRAQREGAIEPVSFIEGCLREVRKLKAPKYGDERISPDGQKQVYDPACGGWQNVYS